VGARRRRARRRRADAGARDAGKLDAAAVDAGAPDGATVDAVAVDAAAIDAGEVDATTIDAGEVDAAAIDAGEVDAAAVDAAAIDAGEVDAAAVDAAARDAGEVDAGAPDAGEIDAGEPDAGAPDAGAPTGGCGGTTGCPPPPSEWPVPAPLPSPIVVGLGDTLAIAYGQDTVAHAGLLSGGLPVIQFGNDPTLYFPASFQTPGMAATSGATFAYVHPLGGGTYESRTGRVLTPHLPQVARPLVAAPDGGFLFVTGSGAQIFLWRATAAWTIDWAFGVTGSYPLSGAPAHALVQGTPAGSVVTLLVGDELHRIDVVTGARLALASVRPSRSRTRRSAIPPIPSCPGRCSRWRRCRPAAWRWSRPLVTGWSCSASTPPGCRRRRSSRSATLPSRQPPIRGDSSPSACRWSTT
jgi:hypothetical protein